MQLGLALPWVSLGSDAEARAPEGVFLKSSTHPRAYGNFARLLGKYVRDEKVLTLQDAVRRLTGCPRRTGSCKAAAVSRAQLLRRRRRVRSGDRRRPARRSTSRSSTPPASSTCSSTACRCCATASTPARSRTRGARPGCLRLRRPLPLSGRGAKDGPHPLRPLPPARREGVSSLALGGRGVAHLLELSAGLPLRPRASSSRVRAPSRKPA